MTTVMIDKETSLSSSSCVRASAGWTGGGGGLEGGGGRGGGGDLKYSLASTNALRVIFFFKCNSRRLTGGCLSQDSKNSNALTCVEPLPCNETVVDTRQMKGRIWYSTISPERSMLERPSISV